MPFPVPTSVHFAVPVRRRRPCRFRLDDGLLGQRPCRFLRQRFLRRLRWHYLCRRPSCRSFSQRRPRLHRKRRRSSFVALPVLSAVQPPAPTVVRSRLRCLSPYRLPYDLPCRSVADGRSASDSTTAVWVNGRAASCVNASCAGCRGTTCVDGSCAAPSANVALGCIESDGSRRSWHFRCYLQCSLLRRRSCVVDCGAFPRTDFRTFCRAGPSPKAVPLPTRRRPFRSTAVPLPASTLPAPTDVALLVSTAVVPLPQPTSPSAASKATALVIRGTSGAICRAASSADGRA